LAALAFLIPMAAFGDISGTVTVNANQYLNLETGATSSSSGDLLWTGTVLKPQGKAIALDVTQIISSVSGSTGYAEVNAAELQAYAFAGSSGQISGVAANDIIGVEDSSGNYAKLLVTAVSSTSISFQYYTYGATGSGGGTTTPTGPTITAIQNNYSYLVPGLPNYGIAPGTLFIIKGTGMANATTVTALQNPGTGLPTSLNGASISVTVGGVTAAAPIYYAIATQIAAVLPSNLPAGTGTLTLTYNGTTTSPIVVLTSALGLDTFYGTGSGLGVATNATTGALYSYTNSIPPGTTVVIWGSGLGSTGDSDTLDTSTPHAVSNPPTFYIGGVAVTPLYAGRSVYPGVDQINLTIPASVPQGCGVSVVAVSGSVVSNTVTLPIMAGGGVCSDPVTGVTGTQINTLTGTTSYNSGALFLLQDTVSGQTEGVADAIFQSVQTTTSSTVSGLTSLGSCTLATGIASTTGTTTSTGLNAGTITVTGPTGTATLTAIPTVTGDYAAQLPSGFIPASGGTYTFKGSGGTQVGAFSVSVAYTSPLVWTNSSSISAITRASGVTVTWTGGASGSYVYIGGSSSSAIATGSFVCYAPASAGSFTVPSYVLLGLPAGSGSLLLENITTPVSFSATGLQYGEAFAGVGFNITPNYN
jgi:uncharacterized protein (TIGR03437 family)